MSYFSPNAWLKWFISFAVDIPVAFTPELHKQTWQKSSQSPAVEVFHFREQYGFFASNSFRKITHIYISTSFSCLASPSVRSPRSDHVRFQVGQVIRHKTHGYRGVIIGWDETVRAAEQGLKQYSVIFSNILKFTLNKLFVFIYTNAEHKPTIQFYSTPDTNLSIKLICLKIRSNR